MIEKVDLKGGKVEYNSFGIDLGKPFEDQEIELQEDLMQIRYGKNCIVDVGFYGSISPDCKLTIMVIKNCD